VTHPDEATLLCRRGPRCANTTPTTTTLSDGTTLRAHVPDRATTPGGLCRTDLNRARAAIDQLPRDYLELSLLLGKSGARTDLPTTGTRERPVPLRLGVLALQEEIATELALWAGPVAELDGFVFTERGRPEHLVRYASGWIIGRWPSLLAVPLTTVARLDGRDERLSGRSGVDVTEEDGVDGALRLLELHERTEAVEGRTHRAHRLYLPCPNPACQRMTLERQEGSDRVDCRRCGHRMPLDEAERLTGILAAAYEGRVHAA